jgi:hypothetical protein
VPSHFARNTQSLCSLFLSLFFFVALMTLAASARDSSRTEFPIVPDGSLFLPAVPYGSGGWNPHPMAVADVNGDGKLDLVVANHCASLSNCANGTVGVLLGNGDGTFQAAVTYDAGGTDAEAVAAADLNGDGKIDIVVGHSSAGRGPVGVLLGNGDGTFQPFVTYEAGGSVRALVVADVNGDGKPDIIAGTLNNDIGILFGKGDGTFSVPVIFPSGGSGGIYSVAAADVNGDGKVDVIAANQEGGNGRGLLSVLLGNGDGSFQPIGFYDSGGFEALSVAVADINGDGKPDLAVANLCNIKSHCTGGVVAVLSGNGDGTFQTPVSIPITNGVYAVAAEDVNGDGKVDVLMATCCATPGAGVLLGNGDGTFQPEVDFGSGGSQAKSVAVADVNGDGKPDLLVVNLCDVSCANGAVGVLLNSESSVKSATSTSLTSNLNPSIYGQKVIFTATVASSGSTPPSGKVIFTWNSNTIGSATLNGSGVATLTKSNLNADTYPLTATYKGDTRNLASTSPVLSQVVQPTTSAARITSSLNPSVQGQAVTFTAKITSPTVVPTGPVTFTAGKTVLGTGQLSGGKATLTTSSLPAGSIKVTATYNGNSNIAKSSAWLTQIVNP